MNEHQMVFFEEAARRAVDIAQIHGSALGGEVTLVRDLRGRIRILLPGSEDDYQDRKKEQVTSFADAMSKALGVYGFSPDQSVLFTKDLFMGESALETPDRRLLPDTGDVKIFFLERQIIGQDWVRSALPRKTINPRVTFYGIKGGVGRSTALVIWAWTLARQGKKVLVFDLDLESPGISSTLLEQANLPDYGIIDWFVEDGVGQAQEIERFMIASSPIAAGQAGEIKIIPAFGRETGDYIPKLARCYSGFSENGTSEWAERVQRMVEQFEIREEPDLVILDSRAGLHDIAAALVTRMDADTFLFAIDSAQTWDAYTFLFRHWKDHPQIWEFRKRLQIVAGLIPETRREEYSERFRENSWNLFLEYLYDEANADEAIADVIDSFSFDVNDTEAPHYPLPIYWQRALQEFTPTTEVDENIVQAAYGQFIEDAGYIVFPTE